MPTEGGSRLRGVVLTHLRDWRRYRALTQTELARQVKVSRPTIARAEAGNPVSMPNIRALAKALDITVPQLYGPPEQVL